MLDTDGTTTTVSGSGSNPYLLRNIGGVLDCSCPAWRNQSRSIDKRTCKHLILIRGIDSERSRVGEENLPTKFQGKAQNQITPMTPAPVIPPSNGGNSTLAVLLAKKYEWDWDPTGYWLSEKLDGIRAYWNGQEFLTRNGNVLYAPDWFKAGMPKEVLDGELWIGRHRFQETMSAVRRQNGGELWRHVKYRIFDAPNQAGGFEVRLAYAKSLSLPAHAEVLEHICCESQGHLERYVHDIIKLGGEGAMLRKPGSNYERTRSSTLFKVKRFQDDEATVIALTPGKGKHQGVLGALVVRWNEQTFNIGSGLTDADRRNPPAIGSTITFRYTECTKLGIPKCGSFVAIRNYE